MAFDLATVAQLALLGGVGYLMFRTGGCCGAPRRPAATPKPSGIERTGHVHQPEDPERTLKLRLARGEIDVEQYERLRVELTKATTIGKGN